MIDLQYLATVINRIVGANDFAVYLNTNVAPAGDGRTVVTLAATRTPFGFTTEEIDAESLSVTLTFDLSASNISLRDRALFVIKNTLLGWQSFTVVQPEGDTYAVESFLEQQAPANPYVDSGGITQQIVVSGTILIKNAECGAVVGNNVGIYLDDVKLLKAQRGGGMQSASENNLPLSQGGTLPQNRIVSRTHTTQLTCIYTGKPIEKEFLKIAEGCVQEVNRIYTYRVEYPDLTIVVPVKIQAVSITDGAGVFLQYTLTLQTAEEAISGE